MKPEDLHDWLAQDSDSPEEADALLPILQKLERWDVPPTSSAELIRVGGRLLEEMRGRRSHLERLRSAITGSLFWLVLRAQIRIVHHEIWLASAFVILIGTLVTLAKDDHTSNANLPLVLLAPIAAAGGIAFIYGPAVDPPFEILMSTPFSPRLVLLARLVLVFSFNLVMAFLSSLCLAAFSSQFTLWGLIVAWLVPMTFLSAFAFCLGVVTKEPLLGALTSLIVWFLQFVDISVLRIPDLTTADARPLLLIVAAILGTFALWLIGLEEHWLGENAA